MEIHQTIRHRKVRGDVLVLENLLFSMMMFPEVRHCDVFFIFLKLYIKIIILLMLSY